MRPGARSLRVAQNRIAEKDFVRGLGLETTPYAAIEVGADNAAADARIGRPAVLKTQTLGYDGKGQVVLGTGDDLLMAWRDTLGSRPAILEALAPIEREVSVIVARAPDGAMACFDPVENSHVNGILDVTLAPAGIPPALARVAREGAERIAQALDHVGVLCVELFVTTGRPATGQRNRPPRPQLRPLDHRGLRDQPVRAAHPRRLWPAAGLNGKTRQRLHEEPDRCGCSSAGRRSRRTRAAHLHLYGKAETRAGRKMGHVTWLGPLDAPASGARLAAGGRSPSGYALGP